MKIYNHDTNNKNKKHNILQIIAKLHESYCQVSRYCQDIVKKMGKVSVKVSVTGGLWNNPLTLTLQIPDIFVSSL